MAPLLHSHSCHCHPVWFSRPLPPGLPQGQPPPTSSSPRRSQTSSFLGSSLKACAGFLGNSHRSSMTWGRAPLGKARPPAYDRAHMTPEAAMILYPAIDLKDGQCVRLLRGEMEAATVFGDDPAAQALKFEAAGCEWLHLVDLNGAFAGAPVNGAAVEAILARLKVPAQLGGGIRDMATIAMWLEKGLARVILGTVAVENPALVREAARAFPGKVAVGIDARKGFVATKGWATETTIQATDLARSFEDAGVAAIIYTDIDRDGAMQGPNIEATEALARAVSIPVIASGGVSTMADLIALRDTGVIAGAISGRALYDGAIDLATALHALKACFHLAQNPRGVGLFFLKKTQAWPKGRGGWPPLFLPFPPLTQDARVTHAENPPDPLP